MILLDIMLPDEDGLEIVRKLRSIPDTKKGAGNDGDGQNYRDR